MSRGLRTVVACVAMAGLLTGCAGGGAASGPAAGDDRFVAGSGAAQVIEPADRKAGPEVSGRTLDDAPLSLDDYSGDVVVVNFWASWCAPCRAEAPALQQLFEENADKGVRFLGVDIKDAKAPAQAFMRSFKVTYPSLFDDDGQITLAFRDVPPNAVPSTLVLDRQGRVAVRIIGGTTYSKLRPLLAAVVAERR